MFNKKGQITVFVIVGIVILAAVGLFFYLSSQTQTGPEIGGRTDVTLETVPEEFRPIRQYVESCMLEIAEEGVRKLALHGGYIDPEDPTYSYYDFVYDPLHPTESEMVSLGLNEDSPKMPYWYYLTGANTCDYCPIGSLSPSITFMELQLAVYIENNLNQCLDGFADLEVTGFEVNNKSLPSVDVTIFDGGQDFLLNYELEASKEGVSQVVNDYYVKSELPLKKLYDTAFDITRYESLSNHIADYTKNLIAINSGPSMELLPPLFHEDESRFTMFWMSPVVEQKIKTLILSYSQIWQVLGSKNFDDSFFDNIPEDDTSEKALYMQGILPIFAHDDPVANSLEMNIIYAGQPMYVSVWPHEGMKIVPNSDKTDVNIPLLPKEYRNEYKFFYDISYPLIINLRNVDNDNRNNNLEFNFPIEINLRKNYKLNDLILGRGPVPWDDDLVNVEIINTDTSQPPENSEIIPGEQASQNIFCKDSQRRSGNISLMTYDPISGDELVDAEVSYGCGTYAECPIGLTEFKQGSAYFSDRLPLCNNGYIQIEKEGYQTIRKKLTTESGKSENLGTIAMYPKIKKNVSIKKFNLMYNMVSVSNKIKVQGEKIDDNSSELSDEESAMITLTRLPDEIESNFEIYVQLQGNETEEIELIPGKYVVDIMYINDEGVVIPEECDSSCIKRNIFKTCTKRLKYPSEPIELKPAPWGGLEFSESRPFSIRRNELYNQNTSLELYTLVYPLPNEVVCLKALEEMDKKEEYTLKYRSKVVPKFIEN